MGAKEVEQLLNSLRAQIGKEIAVSDWLLIDQQRIDAFAEVTGDRQWIHIDPDRAAAESPFGATVAHGFLTLSLLPYLTGSNSPDFMRDHFPGMSYRVNMGVNRVRFPAPVRSGARIRARTRLMEAETAGDGLQVVYRFTVEVEGEEKPGCVADSVVRVYP